MPALAPAVASTIPGVADYFRLTSWGPSAWYTYLVLDPSTRVRYWPMPRFGRRNPYRQ